MGLRLQWIFLRCREYFQEYPETLASIFKQCQRAPNKIEQLNGESVIKSVEWQHKTAADEAKALLEQHEAWLTEDMQAATAVLTTSAGSPVSSVTTQTETAATTAPAGTSSADEATRAEWARWNMLPPEDWHGVRWGGVYGRKGPSGDR